MALQLRTLTALVAEQSLFPAPILGSSQLPVTPAPGPPPALGGTVHTWSHTDNQTHTHIHK